MHINIAQDCQVLYGKGNLLPRNFSVADWHAIEQTQTAD